MIIRSMKCSLTLMILYLSVLISSAYALAEENQPNILILNSYHQGENWTDNEIAGIFSELLTQYPHLVPLVEALDTKRYPSPAHLDFLKDYLLRKYHERKIDLIIALDNPALNLITQNPIELFPDVPVVFAGINGFRPEMVAERKKITGVIERQDVAGTLKMALAMHPKVSRILAVHDYTASGLAVRQETETALAQFAGKLQISYSADVPFDTLSGELKKMPDNGLVLILTYVTDKAGHTFTREESTRLITSLSPAPVYAMHETRLGFGIMGGKLLEGKEHGRQAARLACRILQGEDPDRIAVEESHSRSILDYEGLRRFQISEDLWPKDAFVVNRPISFWSRHRNVLIPSIAAIIVLLGMSSVLLGTVIRLRRAKKTIHKSEEKYRVLFDAFPLGITVSDQDGKIVETNSMAANILSVPKEEHEARKVDGGEWRIIRPDGTPMPVGEYASTRALQEKQLVENIEMGIVKPDAGITWLSVTAAPLNLENFGVVVTYLDVTARREAEEELRKRESLFRTLVDTIPDLIWLKDTDGVYLSCNKRFERFFGAIEADIIGKTDYDFVDKELADFFRENDQKAIAVGGPSSNEEQITFADDGHTAFLDTIKMPMFGADGKLIGVLGIGRDITDRKQAEAKLAESEGILRDIMESTLSGFWDWNLVTNTEYLSPTLKRMFGYEDHEMENSPEAWQKIIFPEDLPCVLEVFDRHVKSRGQEPFYNEIRYRHRDGSTVWVICAGRVIEWAEDGAPIRMVGCHIDITERNQAQESDKKSNKLLQTIINTAPMRIFYKDRNLRYMGCNNAFAKDAGVASPEDVVGKDDYQLAWKEQAELYRTDDLRVLESGIPKLSYDEPQTTPEGKLIWLQTSKVPLLNDSNEIIGVLGMYEDISDRKRAEEALREQRDFSESLIETAQAIILVLDTKGRIVRFNPYMEKLVGYDLDEVKGMDWFETFLTPEIDRTIKPLFQKAVDDIQTSGNVNPIIAKDGRAILVEWYNKTLKDKDGCTVGILAIGQDITEREQAEEALRESQQFNKQIIQSAKEGIIVYGPDLRYQAWNPFMEQMTGIPASEVLGKYPLEVFPFLQETRVIERLEKVLAGEIVNSIDFPFCLQSTGKSGWTRDNSASFQNDKGEIVGVIGIVSDITESKRLEEEQKMLQSQLQQAQKMEAIGTLAGGIAHDFNNILGAILGYAEMAQEDSPAGSILRQDIDQIVKASHRARELVKQILSFSRQAETEHMPLQPASIVVEAIRMLRSSLPSTIDIKQNIDMAAGLILASPTQIHQIVMNLGTNAFHAMEEAGGTLTISLEKKTLDEKDSVGKPGVQSGDFVQLSIGDTGPGIAPEFWDKIFDPYFTTKEVGKGTGMGLAIIHGIVKSYGGWVSFQSHPGKGTVFQVLLPVMAKKAGVENEPEETIQFGNERILFIDDEKLLAEMGKSMLERLGYQVTVLSSSLEALTIFQNQPDKFDLVITDQTMPGMTGSDLARRILQIRPFMPIILCTGYSSIITEEKARSLGIKGFAMKPLARKSIAVLIREVLDGDRLLPLKPDQ